MTDPHQAASGALFRLLLPQLTVIAVMFLVTGIGLATVPLFITRDLQMGATAVGLSSGAQFIASIALRINAGRYSDRAGSGRAVALGLVWTGLSGALCLLAYLLREWSFAPLTLLILGRIALGGGESYLMSGIQTWTLRLAGTGRSATVIGWVGTAMFSALALGAPLGAVISQIAGFGGVGAVMIVAACGMWLLLRRLSAPAVQSGKAASLRNVLSRVKIQGFSMALAGLSYGAMITFSVILFVERDWSPSWGALTAFSIALILARITFGSVPDRIGGTRAALCSLILLAAGLALMAIPGSVLFGLSGAVVAGLGYAVVYPAIVRETVQRVDAESRGTAIALISASIYVTMGLGNPLLGMMADQIGTAYVFLVSAGAAICAALVLLVSEPISVP